ncbi:MAG: hypothetical protein C0482_08290 [Gordonia sp.]|nr:hypothetical protein [Gordonia sp. (in: high G+C Gram-positive bacteria)]
MLAAASTVTSDADQIVDAVAVDSSTTGIASGAAGTTFGVRAPVTSPTATTTGDDQIRAIVDARRSARSTSAFDGCGPAAARSGVGTRHSGRRPVLTAVTITEATAVTTRLADRDGQFSVRHDGEGARD